MRVLLSMMFAALVAGSPLPVAAHVNLSATLDAQQAGVTDAPVGAGGTATFEYESETNTLSYELTLQNLSGAPLVAHLHLGAPGVAGDVKVPLPASGVPAGPSGSASGAITPFPVDQVENLYAGLLYLNFHTAAHLGGEVRGQVLVDKGQCSCQSATSPGAFKSCVRHGVKGLSKEDRKESDIKKLLGVAPKSSCGKKKTSKKAIACCLPTLPEGNIVTGQLCAPVPAAKCTKLGGTSAGDGLSCLPTNPCPQPAD